MNRDRIDEAIRHLSVWARRSPWQRLWDEVLEQHVGAVARKAGLDHDALEAELGHHAHMMLLGCAFEDFLSRRVDERGRNNIIDDYLDQRAWREAPVVREYLRALRDSVMSLYEVVDKVPGTHLVLRDLVRGGEPVTVDERLGSLSTARWDRLGVRVLRVGERNVLSGGLLHFPFEAAERVLRVLRAGTGAMEAGMPQEMLDADARDRIAWALVANAAHVFSNVYLAQTLDALRESPPEMVNFEGDPLVFTTLRFPLAMRGQSDVAARLDRAAGLERIRGETARWNWKAEAAPPARRDVPAAGLTFGSFDEKSQPLLGQVELSETEVVLRVNSVNRAERGQAMLVALLGELIGEPARSTQTLDEARREHDADRIGPRATDRPPEAAGALPLSADEQARLVRPLLEQHYRRILDQPVPALGDVSPRQAVRSEDGRARVVDWLKYLENMEERRARRAGGPAFDVRWMWEELSVMDRRR